MIKWFGRMVFDTKRYEIICENRPASNPICDDTAGERKQAPNGHNLLVIMVNPSNNKSSDAAPRPRRVRDHHSSLPAAVVDHCTKKAFGAPAKKVLARHTEKQNVSYACYYHLGRSKRTCYFPSTIFGPPGETGTGTKHEHYT